MYCFTIPGGASQRPLVQYFQPLHADQIETIPRIKDMVAKFKLPSRLCQRFSGLLCAVAMPSRGSFGRGQAVGRIRRCPCRVR